MAFRSLIHYHFAAQALAIYTPLASSMSLGMAATIQVNGQAVHADREYKRDMMEKVLYSAGYGNRKPDEFLKLLKDAGITVVLDVRRKGSKSWCDAYRWGVGNGFGGMENLLKQVDILYLPVPDLANPWKGGTDLAYYKWWVDNGEGQVFVSALRDEILPYTEAQPGIYTSVFCIVCSELKAFDKLASANCHRVPVADALVKQLGDGWDVVHL